MAKKHSFIKSAAKLAPQIGNDQVTTDKKDLDDRDSGSESNESQETNTINSKSSETTIGKTEEKQVSTKKKNYIDQLSEVFDTNKEKLSGKIKNIAIFEYIDQEISTLSYVSGISKLNLVNSILLKELSKNKDLIDELKKQKLGL